MKYIRIFGQILVGLTFIFSGLVKAIDPLGSAYKFHDYFQAFNLGFLNALSLFLAILLCTSEFIVGFSVLSGIRQKTGITGALILMLIFTPLTFILAILNPVSDCGCFGDAVKLTNWQTFEKNIVLLAFVLFLFRERKAIKNVFNILTEWTIIGLTVIVFVLFALYNLRYLPVIDFLPYKTGVRIADKMILKEGMPSDEYKTTFIYEKNGEKKEFTLTDYPANDTTWKFVDQKSVLIKKGYQPEIHDFSITSQTGDDLTQKILNETGYTLIMISKKLSETDGNKMTNGFETGKLCLGNGIGFYIFTSSGTAEISKINNGLAFCSVDETTLKTIVRSNPGYLLLKNGVIEGKWSWANLPEKEWFVNLSQRGKEK